MKKSLLLLLVLCLVGSVFAKTANVVVPANSQISAQSMSHRSAFTSGEFNANIQRNREVLFQQLPEEEDWSAGVSDANSTGPYYVADNFYGVDGTITGISFTGLDLSNPWAACDEDPMTFDIDFYADNDGVMGDLQVTHEVTLTREATGVQLAGFDLFTWTGDLPAGVTMTEGWIAIIGTSVGTPADGWFLWLNSPDGDGANYADGGTGWAPGADALPDRCFTLTGESLPDTAPAAPTDVVVTPAADGTLTADLTWTNPSLDYAGNALAELTEMRVYRGTELVYTDDAPTIGGTGSYTDTVTESGEYAYSVVGFNADGEGLAESAAAVWIGEDVPAAVISLTLADELGNASLTWENPTVGFHNGPFNNPILGYHIVRSDEVVVELDGIATSYTDETIAAADYYTYSVQAFNATGDGEIAVSNTVMLGAGTEIFFDDFEEGLVNWTSTINSGVGEWLIYAEPFPNTYDMPESSAGNVCAADSDEAGSGTTTDCTIEIAAPLDFSPYSSVNLQFDTHFNAISESDICTIDITTDGGATWTNVLTYDGGIDVVATHEIVDISAQVAGASSASVRFVSVQPGWDWFWVIDNVGFYGVNSGDPGTIEGTVTLNGGEGNIEEVVVNAGNSSVNPAADGTYTISVFPSTYTVTASLEGYEVATVENVVVEENVVTSDIDLALDVILAGSIEGTVTLVDGEGSVEAVTITVGELVVNPAADGTYVVDVMPGTYDVVAELETYETVTLEAIVVENGVANTGNDITLTFVPEEILPPTDLTADFDGDDTVTLNWSDPTASVGAVLFVDDDGSNYIDGFADTQDTYASLFTALGVDFTVYETTEAGGNGPDATFMNDFDVVVWECGEQWSAANTLTPADEANLATFIDAGGKVIISAHDYMWDAYPAAGSFNEGDFCYDYLGIASVNQDFFTVGESQGGPAAVVLSGAGYTSGLSIDLIDIYTTDRDGVYLDAFTPNANAVPFTIYDGNNVGIQTANTIITTAGFASLVDGANTVEEYFGATLNFTNRSRDLTGYKVYKDNAFLADVAADVTTYVDADLADGTYSYYVTAMYGEVESEPSNTVDVLDNDGDASEVSSSVLLGNYPNPFNPVTSISFNVAENSHVELVVYNVKGQIVKTLVNDVVEAGTHKIVWNGTTDDNTTVGSGMYFYKMKNGRYTSTKKMILIK